MALPLDAAVGRGEDSVGLAGRSDGLVEVQAERGEVVDRGKEGGKWLLFYPAFAEFFRLGGQGVVDDDDELNINPPTPCLGKRPQRPKPKGPGRPCGQDVVREQWN